MESNKTTDNNNLIKNNQAIRFIEILIGFGLLSIFVYALRMMWSYDTLIDSNGFAVFNQFGNKIMKETISFRLNNIQVAVSFFSIGILVAGSALTFGSLVGFLFAIPKKIINTNTGLAGITNKYIGNDNLVEVSDWLTKIIVGVSLTQLMSVPGYLHKYGEYVGKSIGGGIIGEVAAISIVVYFLICGFLLAYLWTRLYFAKMLEESENEE
jgi:hypothetical protein